MKAKHGTYNVIVFGKKIGIAALSSPVHFHVIYYHFSLLKIYIPALYSVGP
jgi:hypothetical protein